MGSIRTAADAKRYLEHIMEELERFSEGGPVVTVLNGSRESEITAEILRRALGDRAVTPDVRDVARADMSFTEQTLAMFAFWRKYIEEHGPVAYCFAVTADDLDHWDEVAEAAGIPRATSSRDEDHGLFRRRFEALRGVTSDELGLLEEALNSI